MPSYFTRDRFGRPQLLAALLLLAFLGQAIWLVHAELSAEPLPEGDEALRMEEGWKQWHHRGVAAAPRLDPSENALQPALANEVAGFDTQRSPLLYLVTAAPLLAWPHDLTPDSARYWRWLPRLPFLACGAFLGASLWYVARRLCGNLGGFVALTFYCFSPSLIQASAAWHTEPEIAAAWGAFGTIFTAIAVAHTLYAPREVVLWNWRRIVLLGVSMAIAVGSQFSLIILAPVALGFLLYVAPVRRLAGTVIWLAACGVACVLVFALYSFHAHSFADSIRHAEFWGATWRGFTFLTVYKHMAMQIARACPAFALALPVALVTYAAWPRTRYFGNTVPLLMAVAFIALAIAHPHVAGAAFLLTAIPFLFIFVSGILADLMETSYRPLIVACVAAMLVTYAVRTLIALSQVPRG
ncbi:MAG TPA: hypothetical protein VFA67_12805 [Candidatus Sulfotelmatobacter sp.]|nr:hypothetical protein [Candidatus Sulfotelmatobacter sp.]